MTPLHSLSVVLRYPCTLVRRVAVNDGASVTVVVRVAGTPPPIAALVMHPTRDWDATVAWPEISLVLLTLPGFVSVFNLLPQCVRSWETVLHGWVTEDEAMRAVHLQMATYDTQRVRSVTVTVPPDGRRHTVDMVFYAAEHADLVRAAVLSSLAHSRVAVFPWLLASAM